MPFLFLFTPDKIDHKRGVTTNEIQLYLTLKITIVRIVEK